MLTRCISPVSREAFLARHWETRPLVVFRDVDKDRFEDLLSHDTFDELVFAGNLHYPFCRILQNGNPVPIGQCTTSRQVGADIENAIIDLNVLYSAYADGATIALQSVERFWAPLADFCAAMQDDLGGHETQAYAYRSPPGSHAIQAHYDTHDVFMLQVAGAKQWRIWNPVAPLPMRRSEDTYDFAAVRTRVQSDTPVASLRLTAGDVLYLPRGFIHEGVAGSHGSLHISIGVMVSRWLDVLTDTVRQVLAGVADDLSWRRAAGVGRNPGEGFTGDQRAEFNRLKFILLSQLSARSLAVNAQTLLRNRRDSHDHSSSTVAKTFAKAVEHNG